MARGRRRSRRRSQPERRYALPALEDRRRTLFLVATAEGRIPSPSAPAAGRPVTALPSDELERAARAALERDEHEVEAETLRRT
jgi:hypothetical protein